MTVPAVWPSVPAAMIYCCPRSDLWCRPLCNESYLKEEIYAPTFQALYSLPLIRLIAKKRNRYFSFVFLWRVHLSWFKINMAFIPFQPLYTNEKYFITNIAYDTRFARSKFLPVPFAQCERLCFFNSYQMRGLRWLRRIAAYSPTRRHQMSTWITGRLMRWYIWGRSCEEGCFCR